MAQEKRGYAFTLKGEGIDFAGEVSQGIASVLLDVVMKRSSLPQGNLKPAGGRSAAHNAPRTSVREFLDAHGAKRIPEKITAIGEYLTNGGASDFSKDEVLKQFRIARETMPGNFARDFNWAIATGWIAEDGQSPDRFYITQSGKHAVEQRFSGEATKNSGFRSVRRKRRRS